MAKLSVLSFVLIVAIIFCLDCQKVATQDALKCCYDNQIGSCNPGKDDETCNTKCLQSCPKGGFCKVFKHKPPNHYCHCYCWSPASLVSTWKNAAIISSHILPWLTDHAMTWLWIKLMISSIVRYHVHVYICFLSKTS